MDLGLYNKAVNARGSHGTLIDEWQEERALAEHTGLTRYGAMGNDHWQHKLMSDLRTTYHSANMDGRTDNKSTCSLTHVPHPASEYAQVERTFWKNGKLLPKERKWAKRTASVNLFAGNHSDRFLTTNGVNHGDAIIKKQPVNSSTDGLERPRHAFSSTYDARNSMKKLPSNFVPPDPSFTSTGTGLPASETVKNVSRSATAIAPPPLSHDSYRGPARDKVDTHPYSSSTTNPYSMYGTA